MHLGRQKLVAHLTDLLIGGEEVLLHGPRGIGKTTLLQSVAARARGALRPVGFAASTEHLADVTRALSAAYPEACGLTQRGLRGTLRRSVERRPAVLILDHVLNAPTALKGFLRSLRGTGNGPRDRSTT